MERGLLWLPLLLFFIGLAWVGWNEYQKVEAYQRWAEDFEQAKYDIYAVLGQKGRLLTYGKPHRDQPIELHSFSLDDVRDIQLWVNQQKVDISEKKLPQKGKPSLCFYLEGDTSSIEIPFTDISLAVKWLAYLQKLGIRS